MITPFAIDTYGYIGTQGTKVIDAIMKSISTSKTDDPSYYDPINKKFPNITPKDSRYLYEQISITLIKHNIRILQGWIKFQLPLRLHPSWMFA